MKKVNLILSGFFVLFLISCTDDFNEINEQPNALSADDVSAKFFVTNLQTGLYAHKSLSILERTRYTCG